jgi:hypothetical protein
VPQVDADTGEEVAPDEIMKGNKVDTDTYIEITQDELEIRAGRPLGPGSNLSVAVAVGLIARAGMPPRPAPRC